MPPCRRQGLRSGFTLIELLIAVVLIDCALLALAGGAAVVVRGADATQRRALARLTAENRVARLRSVTCPEPQAGVAWPAAGMRETWQVVAVDASTRLIDDSVDLELPGRHAVVALHSASRC